MPSILFHEFVGDKIAKKYKKYDTANFYLGVMVPDAVNAYGFASKEERWKAHLRDEDLNKWQNNVINFYKENYHKYENTYFVGYVVHILTDIFCDKIYKEVFYPDLIKKGLDYNSSYSYYRREIEKFENSNINEKWWKEAQEKLSKGEKIPINNINSDMIRDWIKYNIDEYKSRKYEKEDYITVKFVDEVVSRIDGAFKFEI